MTIRLLAKHGKYNANTIVTLDAATESGLLAAKLATTDLTGGVPYVEPVAPNQRYPVQIELKPNGETVGLVAPDGRLLNIGPAYPGSNICVLGDSIGAQESEMTAGALITKARGAVNCMLAKLGYPWNFEPSDNFAQDSFDAGDVINIKLPLLLAAHATRKYTRCFISLGTNDTNTADLVTPRWTFAQIQANFMTIFTALRGAGIIPVHRGVKPRGNDAAMTKAKLQNMQLTQWLYQLSLTGMIEFIDTTAVYADNSTAFGNSLAGLTYDRVHPNSAGTMLEGGVMADYFRARGVGPGLVFATSQADIYDAIDNPFGVAFNNANPLMQGANAVAAGVAPTGMTVSGGTWSKASRTLANGQTRSDPQVALANTATTHFLFDDWNATGAWAPNQLQPGNVIELRALVKFSGAANVSGIHLRLAESNGTGPGGSQVAHYGLFSQDTAIALPLADDLLYLKSPRVTIREYSGAGNASIFGRVECLTLAGGAGSVTVLGFEPRRVA